MTLGDRSISLKLDLFSAMQPIYGLLMQSIQLITRTERTQRHSTKYYILKLPFSFTISYMHMVRLKSLDLLPLTFWHKYLDMVFFFSKSFLVSYR